jgi:hypothetical protein
MKSLEVTCIISGISRKLFGDYLKKKISDFGSSETLLKSFVSREARGLLRQGFSPEEIQAKLLPKNKQPFSIDIEFLYTLDLPFKRQKPKTKNDKPLSNITKEATKYTSLEGWVKWATENNTCINPNIRVYNSEYRLEGQLYHFCNGCEYFKYCTVFSKKLTKY